MKSSKKTTPSKRDPYFLRKKLNSPEKSTTMASKGDLATKADLAELTNTIVNRFDGLNANMTLIKKDIAELKSGLEDLKVATTVSSVRIDEIEQQTIPALKKERIQVEKELRETILLMEIHNRKQNLLIYGVKKETGENAYEKVREIIGELGLSREIVTNMALVNAHRLPRRHATDGQEDRGPDPLIVRFATMYDRDQVLRHYQQKQRELFVAAREQRDTGNQSRLSFRILIDLPPALKRRRAELEQQAYVLRKQENQSTRVRVVGAEVVLEKREKGTTSGWKKA